MTDAPRITIAGQTLSLPLLGAGVALGTLALDQLTKIWWLMAINFPLFTPPDSFASGPSFDVLPFFNFTMVWNLGMSYGLLQADSPLGRIAYTIFAAVICAGLGWWMRSSRNLATAAGLGLIIGGAVGNNLIDRVFYHAVVDFLHFHIGQFHWYVFNIADAAIVFGVMLLIYDAFWGTER